MGDFEEWGLDLERRKPPGFLPHAYDVSLSFIFSVKELI